VPAPALSGGYSPANSDEPTGPSPRCKAVAFGRPWERAGRSSVRRPTGRIRAKARPARMTVHMLCHPFAASVVEIGYDRKAVGPFSSGNYHSRFGAGSSANRGAAHRGRI
jgi:hypothetical protein